MKLNPKIGEPIRNMGGNCYVAKILSDALVIAEYFGIKQVVHLVGRAPNISYPNKRSYFGELCAG